MGAKGGCVCEDRGGGMEDLIVDARRTTGEEKGFSLTCISSACRIRVVVAITLLKNAS